MPEIQHIPTICDINNDAAEQMLFRNVSFC